MRRMCASRTSSDSRPVSGTLRRVSALETRREPLHSAVALALISALNADLLARYPEVERPAPRALLLF